MLTIITQYLLIGIGIGISFVIDYNGDNDHGKESFFEAITE